MAQVGSLMMWGATLITLVTLAVAGAGLLARHVPPRSVWWLQPLALLLPVAGATVGGIGLAWAARALRTGHTGEWGLAVLCLLVSVLAGWRVLGGHAAVEAEPGDDVLHVLTLNAAHSRRVEADSIAQQFASQRPHIVGFQEVTIRPEPPADWVAHGAPLALLRDSAYALADLYPSHEPWLTNGTALFTRVPTSRSVAALLDSTAAPTSGKYTRTEVRWQGQTIAVYNVHFRSFRAPRPSGLFRVSEWLEAFRASRRDFLAREVEARELRRQLDAETLPFVVMGDFNATPDHWTYAHVADGLVEALNATRGLRGTYPDARPLIRIDGILASPEWSVRQAVVYPPGISDHRAVGAGLVLTQ